MSWQHHRVLRWIAEDSDRRPGCFVDDDITHVENRIDPISDLEIIETELMLADLESLEKRVRKYGEPDADPAPESGAAIS